MTKAAVLIILFILLVSLAEMLPPQHITLSSLSHHVTDTIIFLVLSHVHAKLLKMKIILVDSVVIKDTNKCLTRQILPTHH